MREGVAAAYLEFLSIVSQKAHMLDRLSEIWNGLEYMYYVYLVCRKQDFQWYVGYTSDLRARIQAHNQPEATLQGKFDLIYYEAYLHKLDAIRRECFLKSGAGRDFLKRHLMYFLRTKLPEFRLEQQTATHQVLLATPELVQG